MLFSHSNSYKSLFVLCFMKGANPLDDILLNFAIKLGDSASALDKLMNGKSLKNYDGEVMRGAADFFKFAKKGAFDTILNVDSLFEGNPNASYDLLFSQGKVNRLSFNEMREFRKSLSNVAGKILEYYSGWEKYAW